MTWVREFVRDVSIASGDDCVAGFKLLGMVVYVAEIGTEPLLSGKLVAVSTFHRWVETLRLAGWGDLLADVRLRQALRDYVNQRMGGLPIEQARREVIEAVETMVAEAEALPPQASGRHGSNAVKGLAVGREAEPTALDWVASGGSLQEAAAPRLGVAG